VVQARYLTDLDHRHADGCAPAGMALQVAAARAREVCSRGGRDAAAVEHGDPPPRRARGWRSVQRAAHGAAREHRLPGRARVSGRRRRARGPEAGDARLPAAQRWAGAGAGDTSADALPYWLAAVRELFEEVGILLAADGDRLVTGPLPRDMAALRAPVFGGEPLAAALGRVGLPSGDRVALLLRTLDHPGRESEALRHPIPRGARARGAAGMRRRRGDGELRVAHAARGARRLRGGEALLLPADGSARSPT
jgi:8-oxo-dGTP pyrophosphatase MutT (NUDIX family)